MKGIVVSGVVYKISAVLLALASAGACLADSESTLKQMLKSSGLRVGYDRKEKRLVSIGVAERRMSNPMMNAGFDKDRGDLAKIAILNAKKQLMFSLSVEASGKDVATETVVNDARAASVMSVMKLFSTMELRGCKVLCSAESWDEAEGVFQVSVAMGWSEKMAARANKALSDSLKLDVLGLGDDDPQWISWCEKNDLSTMVGCRQFTDTEGHLRFVGISASTVEGLSGIKLKMAMRKAGLNALGHLAFSLYSDNIAKDTATRYLKEFESCGQSSTLSWESFTSEVLSKCKATIMAHEVYSNTLTYPVTGRKMYVSVYGVALK